MALPVEFNPAGVSVVKMTTYPRVVPLSYAYNNSDLTRIVKTEKIVVYEKNTKEIGKLTNLLITTALKAGSDTTCAICLEEVGKNSSEISLGSHACTHLFHKTCLDEWKKKSASYKCLLCKQQ